MGYRDEPRAMKPRPAQTIEPRKGWIKVDVDMQTWEWLHEHSHKHRGGIEGEEVRAEAQDILSRLARGLPIQIGMLPPRPLLTVTQEGEWLVLTIHPLPGHGPGVR